MRKKITSFEVNDHLVVLRGAFIGKKCVMLIPNCTSTYSTVMIEFNRCLVPTKDLTIDVAYYRAKYTGQVALRNL